LAGFLEALHVKAPAQAPVSQDRGVPLRTLSDGFERGLEEVASGGDAADLRDVRDFWDEAVAAPDGEDPPVWLHGDLHPAHVVVSDGALAGVMDFGDMCAGDPAVDLAAARVLVGPTRHRLRGSDNRRPTSWRADCSSSVKPRQ
jgi:aminoglycoside phosphotransferase (APT) family kinase protein